MKRRNVAECGKIRRSQKRNKITDGIYGSTLLYLKFLLVWVLVILADFLLEFRFEFLWPFWLLLRSVYDSYKYQGLAFSVFFVCIALTSDMVCFFFIPVHWLFFAASTYVWVQYVWHTDKGICLPTIILWMLFVYLEAAVRLKDLRHLPFHLDLCRPFAAHCIGYPVVTLGFGFKSYVGYRIRQRKQKDVAKENEFYIQLLQQALPIDPQQHTTTTETITQPVIIQQNQTTTTNNTKKHNDNKWKTTENGNITTNNHHHHHQQQQQYNHQNGGTTTTINNNNTNQKNNKKNDTTDNYKKYVNLNGGTNITTNEHHHHEQQQQHLIIENNDDDELIEKDVKKINKINKCIQQQKQKKLSNKDIDENNIQQQQQQQKLEYDVKKLKNDLQTTRNSEQELKSQIQSLNSCEKSLRSELSQLQRDNDELQNKIQSLTNARQTERQALERRVGEERRARATLEAQLAHERRSTMQQQRRHEEQQQQQQAAAAQQLQLLNNNNNNNNECTEQCILRRRELELEAHDLRTTLITNEERLSSIERERVQVVQQQHDTDILMSALSAMQDKNQHLEDSLSAETRIKLDLFSALGEAKRQLEIRENLIKCQDKEIDELKSKIAQVLAVMPNDSFGTSPTPIKTSRVRLETESPTTTTPTTNSQLDPNATAYTPKNTTTKTTTLLTEA